MFLVSFLPENIPDKSCSHLWPEPCSEGAGPVISHHNHHRGEVSAIITLCNKDFGAWDISTDSISLGVTDT